MTFLVGTIASMPVPTEFFCWWIGDERTGERRLTTYKLTRANAERAFPDAEPDLQTRELRNLPDTGTEPWSDSRPGEPWVDTKPGAWEPLRVGSAVTLPSGLAVEITAPADLSRLWRAVEIAHVWLVCRLHPNQDVAHATYYFGGGREPLQLDEDDARALAALLNSAR